MSKETIEQFEKDRYLFVKGFIDPNLAKLMTTYTLHKVRHEIQPEGADGQIYDFENTRHRELANKASANFERMFKDPSLGTYKFNDDLVNSTEEKKLIHY